MEYRAELGALLRFALGTAASVLAGVALFRWGSFEPALPWFQCVTVGALLAAVLSVVRIQRHAQAASLVTAFVLVHLGYAWSLGWRRAVLECLSAAVVGGGAFVTSLIFDGLAKEGYRFGKFALLGPLVAGVFLSAAAVRLVGADAGEDALGSLVRFAFVGLIVGDAVGIGVELVELIPGVRSGAESAEAGG